MQQLGLGIGIGITGWPPNPGPYPDWLPTAPSGDRPQVYADFVNGHYWLNGSVATVDDIFYEDLNWGSYNPATDIVPGTGLIGGSSPAIVTAIVSPIIAAGATYVYNAALGASSEFQVDMTDLATYEHEWAFVISTNPAQLSYGAGGVLHHADGYAVVGANGLAYTFSPNGDIAVSANGSAVITQANESGGAPNIPGIGIFGGPDNPTYSLAIYQTQSDIGLPTLSTP